MGQAGGTHRSGGAWGSRPSSVAPHGEDLLFLVLSPVPCPCCPRCARREVRLICPQTFPCPGEESPPGESLSLQLLVLFKGIRAKLTLQFATQK